MKKGLTKDEHKELGMKLRKINAELREASSIVQEAYGKGSKQYKNIQSLSEKTANFRAMMDGVCSGDLRSMPNDGWILNHFDLVVVMNRPDRIK